MGVLTVEVGGAPWCMPAWLFGSCNASKILKRVAREVEQVRFSAPGAALAAQCVPAVSCCCCRSVQLLLKPDTDWLRLWTMMAYKCVFVTFEGGKYALQVDFAAYVWPGRSPPAHTVIKVGISGHILSRACKDFCTSRTEA